MTTRPSTDDLRALVFRQELGEFACACGNTEISFKIGATLKVRMQNAEVGRLQVDPDAASSIEFNCVGCGLAIYPDPEITQAAFDLLIAHLKVTLVKTP
jgi:hypothetical protein